MVSFEIRKEARKSLEGKWGKAALLVLVFVAITWLITFVLGLFTAIPLLGLIAAIASFVITPTLGYGFMVSLIKLKRGEDVTYLEFLNTAFSNIGRIWGVIGNTILKMLLPIILLFVFIILAAVGGGLGFSSALLNGSSSSGYFILGLIGLIGYIVSLVYIMIKGFLYSLIYFILYDNENMTGREVVEESERLMKGNRWKFFWLSLTFIGWYFLCAFTFGIGLLWLIPYVSISILVFYENLSGKLEDSDNKDTIVEDNNNPIQEDNDPIQEN